MGVHVPDPIVSRADGIDPEHEALLADSVGLALLVVLETLAPAERLAFVLHDMFARALRGDRAHRRAHARPPPGSSRAARAAACRARLRQPTRDLDRQREVVDAFLAASRGGDFDALLAVLDPDVVLRAEGGAAPAFASREVRGARAVAERALSFSRLAEHARPALVNGTVGLVTAPNGQPVAVMGLTIANGKIVEMDILADPERLRRLDFAFLED